MFRIDSISSVTFVNKEGYLSMSLKKFFEKISRLKYDLGVESVELNLHVLQRVSMTGMKF